MKTFMCAVEYMNIYAPVPHFITLTNLNLGYKSEVVYHYKIIFKAFK